ncbi:MAG: phosphate signaling complex protein PhoU [Alphaproteobacteria bacterium]
MTTNPHTRRSYDEQLEHLTHLILSMGTEVRKLIVDAGESFRVREEQRVKDAKAADKEINKLDLQIEEEATIILALQNPLAIDLRFVTAVLKITGMLERMGDLAKNTVKRSVRMGSFAPEPVMVKLEEMVATVVDMLDEALECFEQKDEKLAIEVWKRDEEIDKLYHDIFEAMQKEMQRNPADVEACTQVVFAAKNMERLADYITNMTKTVYYIVAGERPSKSMLKDGGSGA